MASEFEKIVSPSSRWQKRNELNSFKFEPVDECVLFYTSIIHQITKLTITTQQNDHNNWPLLFFKLLDLSLSFGFYPTVTFLHTFRFAFYFSNVQCSIAMTTATSEYVQHGKHFILAFQIPKKENKNKRM